MKHKSSRFRGIQCAAALVAVIVLSACGSTSSSGTNASSSGGSKSLTVWALTAGPGYAAALDHDVKLFEAQNHAKVTVVWKTFNDVFTAVKLALSGPGAPDIIQLPQGWPMVQLVKAHLLVNLTPYATKYAWSTRFPKAALASAEATPDGKYFGTGNLYGVSDTETFLGWYYNKQKLASLGLAAPSTWAQFQQDLGVAKSHGQVPIEFGDSDQWPALHTFYTILPQFVPASQITSFALGSAGAQPIDSGSAIDAASVFAGWAKRGYLEPGYLGVSSDQALASFLKGQGVFYAPGGSWFASNVIDARQQNNVGFLVIPSAVAGGAAVTTGSVNNPFGVSTRSGNVALAAQFLNSLTDQQSAQEVVSVAKSLPAELYPVSYPHTGVLSDIYSAYQKVRVSGQVPWLDWASNTMYTQLSQNMQSLLGGKMSPAALLATAQENQASFIKSLGR